MKNFKIEVSRGLERYNLIRKSENEMMLREELHKEGFAILSVVEIADVELSGNKFFFEILESNGNKKIGTIIGNDIFKAYLKIKYELKYNLIYIYQNQETSQEEKQKIIKELEAHYNIYLEANKKQLVEKQKQDDLKVKEVKEVSLDSFQMKKELEIVYKVIDKVISKLKNILEIDNGNIIGFEKKELLKTIFNELIKLKTSTNIPKLKQIGELALSKIGEIELEILESNKDKEYEILLNETNKLLKEVGSKKSFIEKEKDIGYIFNSFIKEIGLFFRDLKAPKKQKVKIDTTSTSYLKNKYLLIKYEQKLKKLKSEKLKNILAYIIPTKENKELVLDYSIKEKVILQNITLLKGRISGGIFSYVKIVKGYNYFIDKLVEFINFLQNPIFFMILLYGFIFLFVNILQIFNLANLPFNFNGLFFFLYLILLYILIQFTKGLLSLSFNVVIFSFLFIFGVINF